MKTVRMLTVACIALVPATLIADYRDSGAYTKESTQVEAKKLDKNADGQITRDEFLKAKEEWFTKFDKDNNRSLDKTEQQAMFAAIDQKHEDHKKAS
jgi:Ca2+-binding EF-hand superfamily protein